MDELQEYIISLQDQGLPHNEIYNRVLEWKKKNEKTQKTPDVEEVKTEGVAGEMDATVTPKQTEASESLTSGDGELVSQKESRKNLINEVLGQFDIGSDDRTIAYYKLDLKPDDTVNKDFYNLVDSYYKNQEKWEKILPKKEDVKSISRSLAESNRRVKKYLSPDDARMYSDAVSNLDNIEGMLGQRKKPSEQDIKNISSYIQAVDKLPTPEQPKEEGVEAAIGYAVDKLVAFDNKIEKIKEKGPEGVGERAIGAFFVNMPTQLKQVIPSAQAAFMDWARTAMGEDAVDFMTGDKPGGPIVFIDPETGEEISYKENPDRFRELNSLRMYQDAEIVTKYKGTDIEVGDKAEEFITKKINEYVDLSKNLVDVGSVLDIDDGEKFIGGLFNATQSIVSTVVPALLTRGASIYPQIAAPMYVDYNVAKAESIYGENDPRAIEKLVENNQTEILTPAVLASMSYALESIGLKGITKSMLGKTGLLKPVISLALNANKEGLTELTQTGIERINTSLAKGESLSTATVDGLEAMASKEGLESYLQGVFGATVMGAPSSISRSLIKETTVYNEVQKHIDKIANLNLQRLSNKNKAFREAIDVQIKDTENSLKNILENTNKLSKKLTREEQLQIIGILEQKEANSANLESLKFSYGTNQINGQQYGSAKGALVNKNKRLSSEIESILNEARNRQAEETTAKIEKGAEVVAKELGTEFKPLETTEEVQQEIAKIKKEGGDVEERQAGDYGVYVTVKGKEGQPDKKIILLNKKVAAEDRYVSAAQHEVLHDVLRQTVNNNPDAAVKLGQSLLDEIVNNKKIQGGELLSTRLQQYISDEKYSDAATMEEVMNLLSDSLTSGDVTINESTLDKIGGYIRRALSAIGVKVKFKTGKDVLNFIKDYNKTIETGKGLSRGMKKAATEGATVDMGLKTEVDLGTVGKAEEVKAAKESKRIEEQAKLSKTLTPDQDQKIGEDILEIKKLSEENKAIAAKYGKEPIKGPKQARLESEVLKTIKPLVDKIVTNRTKALYDPIAADAKKNVSREEFKESMRSDIETMALNEYNGKQSLEKFIINRSYLRANSLASRLGIKSVEEGIDQDVTARVDIAAETTPEVELKAEAKLIKPSSFISKEAVDEITKQVKEKAAGIDPKNLTFKKLGIIGEDIVAGEIDIPVKKLVSPTANLSKGDANNIQRFVLKNADKLLKILPEGAVTEAATEKLLGTSTGVPKSLLDKFYTKQDRITKGAGLSPYKLKPNITKSEFLEAFGIVEGKKAEGFNARSSEAQALKGIANLYARLLTNEIVRSSDLGMSLEVKQDIAAGKSKAMASKRIKQANKILEELASQGVKQTLSLYTGDKGVDTSTNEQKSDLLDYLQSDFFVKLFNKLGPNSKFILKTATLAPSGNVPSAHFKRNQLFINSLDRVKSKVDKEALKELKSRGLIGEMQELKNLLKNIDTRVKENKNIEVALKGQKVVDLKRNLKTRAEHVKGYKAILNSFKDLYDSDPTTARGIAYLLYNPNANAAMYRNLAQLTGAEKGLKKGQAREEHVYQAGNWAIRTMQALTSGDKNVWNNWLDWSSKNYYQEAINGKKQGVNSSEYLVDGIYDTNRFTGEKIDRLQNKFQEHPLLKEALDEAILTGDFSNVPDVKIRYYNEYVTLNPNLVGNNGKTDAEAFGVEVDKNLQNNPNVVSLQGELIYKQILTDAGILTGADAVNKTKAKQLLDAGLKTVKQKTRQAVVNNSMLPKGMRLNETESQSSEAVIKELSNSDKALEMARRLNPPVKKIRVFDFDDTLARSKSMVIVNMPDGSTSKINATEFAKQASTLEKEGAIFDFTEFSKVVEGKKGPLFVVAEKIAAARGTDDVFILTARPADSAGPIREFMKANGIDIPLNNIVGLGDGTAEAKARWITGKAAEGYNDFYFADDAIKNVNAVKQVLDQVDVKSRVQQARSSKRIDMDKAINDMIQSSTGIESYKRFSAAKAKTIGAGKGKFQFFIPPSAEDFTGLLYKLLGKGKLGDQQMAFLKETLLDPYNKAEIQLSQAKVAVARDFKALKKQFSKLPKTLEKQTGVSKYTYSHALRTYVWDKLGYEIPGLSTRDKNRLVDFIKSDAELSTFADGLMFIQKDKNYPKPDEDWVAGTVTTDIVSNINKVNRKEYLQEWKENVDVIFSKENLNKIEAAYGSRYREALEDSLRAMESGSNRPLGGDRISNEILDWVNNSNGVIMFLNTRSAVLQTISSVNFLNWSDNNILKAGKAFANQPQYWKDFLELMNSDYLTERRDGLKINVSESEIADAVANSKNKAKSAIAFLLDKGFLMTRFADSFAIASGGATFYRNRIKSLMKQGMTEEQAKEQAFNDFRAISEENQQSSSPAKISQQQRSLIGRMVLAFGNTQLQYARIMKRSLQDLVNKRGDWKTNVSKIVYYGAIQNIMFNALQSGLVWALFDDDEEDKEQSNEKKIERAVNGSVDSVLKGLGIQGTLVSVLKNTAMTLYDESQKKTPEYQAAVDDVVNIVPAIGSKIRRMESGGRTVSWNRKEIKERGFSLDNPAYLAGAQTISGFTNIPVDRALMKINNVRNIFNKNSEMWQKTALSLGWSSWDVGLPYYGVPQDEPVLTPTEIKTQKLFDLKKSEQVDILLKLGLTKKEIRALKKEQQRVEAILKLENKKEDNNKTNK